MRFLTKINKISKKIPEDTMKGRIFLFAELSTQNINLNDVRADF